jgi:hypothetical protein
VVIINEAVTRRYWPGSDPLGQRLRLFGDARLWTVVGVVGNIHEFGLDADVKPITGLLFGIGPADPLALLGAAAWLGAVSLVATLLPARRAALVEPVVAFRAE